MNSGHSGNSRTSRTLNFDGIMEYMTAFDEEREWMHSMLEPTARAKFDRYKKWKVKLEAKFTPKVEAASKHEFELRSIPSLTATMDTLHEERKILRDLVDSFDPNKRRQTLWQSDYADIIKEQEANDGLIEKVMEQIKTMKSNAERISPDTEEKRVENKCNGEGRGDDSKLCVVCLDGERDYAIVPCGHRCLCADCKAEYEGNDAKCPICRVKAKMTIKIFD